MKQDQTNTSEIISLLIKEGLLTEEKAAYAMRVKSKLAADRTVIDTFLDLKYVDGDQVKNVLRANHLSLRIGDLLTEFGYLSQEKLETALNIQKTQKNKRLGTITDNPGIEIAAPRGRPVHAVMEGIVVAITWIPSYGNTLILDHGGGYYTVYAHVEDIQVSADSYVLRNQMVAKVGETGSLDGPRLHFEVWRGETKENPLLWLRK